ncbi:DUF6318 family protein [Rothia sp. LK2588]|uniref:DUF6318 family protein n=1 Tax=Rothia sp. LK2588 TaxID=3114369 RepID=UPI0034CE5191
MTTINQRTALTSAALALALLLSGCSAENPDEKAAEPSVTSSSASSGSSHEPEKAESSKTQDSPSAEASSQSAGEKKYSGGSKAPEGEYRPADEHGPAQNVPVPKIPEGMDVESAEGLEKFVGYWNDTRNYAVETGDTTLVRERTAITHEQAIKNFDSWDRLYLNGGWVIEGKEKNTINLENLISKGDGFYVVPLKEHSADAIVAKNGKFQGHKLSANNSKSYEATFQFSDSGKWFLIEVNPIAD